MQIRQLELEAAIAKLPPPPGACGPYERIVASCRPGEIDVCIRCRETQASVAYVIDEATGQILEGEVLAAHRAGLGSDPIFHVASSASEKGKMGLTPSVDAGLTVSPAFEDKETRGQGDKEHDEHRLDSDFHGPIV